MDNNSKHSSVIIIAIVALVIGMAGGYAISNNKDDNNNDSNSQTSSMVSSKAADLRVTLNQQMRQHVALAAVALKDSASGTKDAKASVAALDANSVELADSIGSVYGNDARDQFLALWREHIGFFVTYTQGVVSKDKAKMAEAKAGIEGYTDEASSFFANANPNINKNELKKGLATHGAQVFGIVDAYAAGDYDKAFSLEDEAYNHIGMAADTISAAVVKQFPNKF